MSNNELTVNDGKGLLDKYGILDEVLTKLDLMADAKGALRCGLIWDVSQMLRTLRKGLKDEDKAHGAKVEELKRMLGARE